MFKAPYLMAAQEWLAQSDNGLCPVCLHVERSFYPRPFDVVLERLPESLYEESMISMRHASLFFANIDFTIWRRDFIDVIKDELNEFSFGHCLLPDGTIIEDYVTCYSPEYLIIRGNKQSRYQICPRCRCIASEIHNSPHYILSQYLKKGPAFQDSKGGLYLSCEDQKQYSLLLKSFNVSLDLVVVRDIPVDGQILPGDKDDDK